MGRKGGGDRRNRMKSMKYRYEWEIRVEIKKQTNNKKGGDTTL